MNPVSIAEDLRAAVEAVPDVYEVPADDAGRESFRVRDDSMAAWALRRYRAVEEKRATIREAASSELQVLYAKVAAVEVWAATEDARLVPDADYFRFLLEDYVLTCRMDPGDGRKSVRLPGGVVKSHTGRDSWQITDQDAAVEWAKTTGRGDIVNVTEKVNVSALRPHVFKDDGTAFVFAAEAIEQEPLPWVTVTSGTVSVTVELTGDGAE